MPRFSNASKDRLITCDHRLQIVMNEAIEIVDFTVLEGHRGKEAQDEAVSTGKSRLAWPKGKHNKLPSMAVDIAPYFADLKDRYDWQDLIAFGRVMGVVQAVAHKHGIKLRFGLDWDGDFRSVNRDPDETFLDAPHVELVE